MSCVFPLCSQLVAPVIFSVVVFIGFSASISSSDVTSQYSISQHASFWSLTFTQCSEFSVRLEGGQRGVHNISPLIWQTHTFSHPSSIRVFTSYDRLLYWHFTSGITPGGGDSVLLSLLNNCSASSIEKARDFSAR